MSTLPPDVAVLGPLPGVRRPRALLLPRRRPDSRTPLWQQRQRAADLLAVAAKYPTFPILLEASRECLQDVFDVPALREVLGRAAQPRRCASSASTRPKASPFAPEPAVQLDRRLHVRGRRAAGRAAGRRAGPRPRPAARAARGGGAARAARPRRAGRPRARAAVPHRRPAGRAAPTSCTTCCAGSATSSPTELDLRTRRHAARRPSGSAQLVAERRAIAVRIGGRGARRRGRGRGPLPGRARLRPPARPARGLHRAGRAPARAARGALRPHPRALPGRRGRPPVRRSAPSASPAPWPRWRPRTGWCGASSGPTASSGSGATSRSCASCAGARSPRCAGRSSRSSRRPWPASCPPGTGSASHRRGLDDAGGGPRAAAGRAARGVDPRARGAAGARARLPERPTSTSCAPAATWCGWAPAGWARRTAGCASPSATSCRCSACSGRGGGAARRCRSTRPSGCTCSSRARRSGTSSGRRRPAASDRRAPGGPVGPRVGRRGHQRLAGAAAGLPERRPGRGPVAAAGRPGRGAPLAAVPGRGGCPPIGPPAGAGRWSLVTPLLEPRPASDRAGPRHGAAAARAPRRPHPGGRAGRGRRRAASPASTACSRCWRSGARCAGATS